ncbi:transporter substrate-binding domain-containing protein [Paenacidovorax monticola]|uniref:Transporter substrate-binding domain-containing protein n=1 Tax=Paenacidovorax monticola TaxID=1926868 RepID=A0A7H0HDE8_9BURK|nr:transporter substrate-binding domain-containing protein [Paenacidovorax monticola]MBO9678782.1 transporter substrate-binding domain-containing protein [Acidovorax sp.]QNP58564.1 transporter substrate-binding domain-containing protein [Paenacidovorax monticola]
MQIKLGAIAAGVLAAATLTLSTGAVAQEDHSLKAVLDKKSIALGIPTDYPPYGFMGPDFKPTGVDVATAQLIADKLGVKAELVPVSTPNRIPYLQSRKIDLIVSALGKNEERQKVIDFTTSYAPFFQAVFGPKNIAIKSFDDLADKTLAVTRGTIQDDALQQLAPKTLKIQRFEDDNATMAAFMTQQTQFVAVGAAVAAAALQKNPKVQAEYKLLIKDSPNYVGVRKGETALLNKVNEILRTAKKDGTLESYSQKWLGRSMGNLPD